MTRHVKMKLLDRAVHGLVFFFAQIPSAFSHIVGPALVGSRILRIRHDLNVQALLGEVGAKIQLYSGPGRAANAKYLDLARAHVLQRRRYSSARLPRSLSVTCGTGRRGTAR